jgi:Histidine kinase-like ATPase domain
VPAQIGPARQFLARVLGGWPTADDAALCLSELAANAILHSRSAEPGGQFTVRVQLTGHDLRVEVADGGGPWVWTAYPDEQHGRGLLIVDSLARSWGQSDGSDDGRIVWYEMTLTGNGGLPAQPAVPATARRGYVLDHHPVVVEHGRVGGGGVPADDRAGDRLVQRPMPVRSGAAQPGRH